MSKKAASFLGGVMFGVGIGAAAAMFFNSEKGRQFRKDANRFMADFYKEMSGRAQEIKEMGQQEYEKFMDVAIRKYAKTKHISKDMSQYLSQEAKKSWDYLTERWQEWQEA
ncbi:MAG: YtxH domain-containing protein [Candidatus Saccharimonadales bacterium]